SGADSVAAVASGVAESVGNPTPEHVDYAAAFHRSIPEPLLQAVHTPADAPLVVYALLLGDVAEERARVARALVRHETGTGDDAGLSTVCDAVGKLDLRYRLPLLDLAAPALRRLPDADRNAVIRIAEKLVRIDRKVTLFEFVLLILLKKQLRASSFKNEKTRYRRFGPVLPEIRILLTLMSRAGARNARRAEEAYARAMASFSKVALSPANEAYCQLDAMEGVLAKLSALSPLLKGSLISACADCVLHDGKITPEEAELLRAVAEALDCPIPPFINSRAVSAAA
ncbi:MAG: hypothetical protein R3337_05335, partial [Gammaproteobacteria bacterium]|nr:hypothetical protein [Gammaproteobacteria bacterium]